MTQVRTIKGSADSETQVMSSWDKNIVGKEKQKVTKRGNPKTDHDRPLLLVVQHSEVL